MILLKKQILFEKVFFVISIISWFYCDYFASFNDDFKYIILLIYGAWLMFNKNISNNNINKKRVRNLLIVYLFMIIISYFFQLYNFTFNILPLKHFFYYVVPLFLAYIIYSRDASNDEFYFNSIFIVSTVVFIIKAGTFLNLSSIFSISFIDSYSPFEHLGFADYYLILFCYYLKKKRLIKCVISAFLCFLCFKRFHLVFIALILLYSFFKNKNRNLKLFSNKLFYCFLFLIFIFSPFLMIYIYSSDFSNYFYQKFGLGFEDFSMGRTYLTNMVLEGYNSNCFMNLGLGSTGEFVKSITGGGLDNMHNDTLRIFLETTFFGTVLFYYYHFKNVYKLPYSTLLLLFLCTTICVSHIMTNFLTWLMFYYFMFIEGDEYYEK